jgi:hypothetical protein
VTAAHCVYDDEDQEITAPSTITVHAGITNRFAAGQHPAVTAVSVNPDYDPDTQTSDVAILTLGAPFSFSATVQAIGLTDVGYRPGPSDGLRLSGWGSDVARAPADETTPHAVDNLNVATLHTSSGCTSVYASFDDNLLLCAGEAGHDACQGDSGGPLAVQVAGVWKLAGIVTGGAGCAWPNYPGYYARVADPDIHAYLAELGAGYAVQDPAVVSPPTITGAAAPGGTLICDVGTWKNAYSYGIEFLRGDAVVGYGSTMSVRTVDVGAEGAHRQAQLRSVDLHARRRRRRPGAERRRQERRGARDDLLPRHLRQAPQAPALHQVGRPQAQDRGDRRGRLPDRDAQAAQGHPDLPAAGRRPQRPPSGQGHDG